MCDSIFTFGQRGNHFFQCPSQQKFTRLPNKLQRLLASGHVARIYHVTLGFEDSFLITYRDKNRGNRIESQKLPAELNDFVYEKDSQGRLLRSIPKLRVTLGSYNNSFFAHDKSSSLWMNLPPTLLSALQSRIKDGAWLDKPRILGLGTHDNFVLITEKHAAVWNLPHYRTLSSMLDFSKNQQRGIEEVHSVVLHAHRYQCFVAQSRNGTLIFEGLPPHEVGDMESMRTPVSKDTQQVEKKEMMKKRDQDVNRRPSLNNQETPRREWSDRRNMVRAEARGLRVSLSVSLSAGGLGKMLGF